MSFPVGDTEIRSDDVLVIFGELFTRGYANGLVDEFERAGATVVRSTVGRRESGQLRPLNVDELKSQVRPFINVPLEAGFDLEEDPVSGKAPVSFFEKVKLSEWADAKADFEAIHRSREAARMSFRNRVALFVKELEPILTDRLGAKRRVVFLHTMAGGVPRAKVIMPVMNRVFKGTGDRFLPSSSLFESDLGRFALLNFEEVTAETFRILVEETEALRKQLKQNDQSVSYMSFGYHGTDVMFQNQWQWQTYTPYFQGWAKMKLEQANREFHEQGLQTTCFNCPEILTNSSSIFQGVEVSLYPLLQPLRMLGSGKNPSGLSAPTEKGRVRCEQILAACSSLLKSDNGAGDPIDAILEKTESYLTHSLTKAHAIYAQWPQNNSKEQMELMLKTSDELIEMHQSEKQLITAVLSEHVFRATGLVQARYAHLHREPVVWIGHDTVCDAIATGQTL